MTPQMTFLMDELDQQVEDLEAILSQVYADRDRLAVLLGLAINAIAQSEHDTNEAVMQRFVDFEKDADDRWHNRDRLAAEIRALVKHAYGDAA